MYRKKENKIIYPKKGNNNNKSKNKKNNNKGKYKNQHKNDNSEEFAFNNKYNFNIRKFIRKRTYNDIAEQKKNFAEMEVESKIINLKAKKENFNNSEENLKNKKKEIYDTYIKMNCLNLK